MDMATVHDAIEQAETNEMLLQMDIAYLANAYINEITNFELPMIHDFDTDVPIISYKELVRRVKEAIHRFDPTIFIDECLLMSYVDYYYETVWCRPNAFSPE